MQEMLTKGKRIKLLFAGPGFKIEMVVTCVMRCVDTGVGATVSGKAYGTTYKALVVHNPSMTECLHFVADNAACLKRAMCTL